MEYIPGIVAIDLDVGWTALDGEIAVIISLLSTKPWPLYRYAIKIKL